MSRIGSVRSSVYARLHSLSLTRRLVTVVVLLVLAAYLVTATVTITLMRGYLTDRIDGDLESNISPLARQAISKLRDEQAPDLVLPNPYYVQITPSEAGDPFPFRTPSTGRDVPDLGRVEMGDERIGQGPFTVEGDGGTQWRVLIGRLSSDQGTVAVALPATSVDNTVKQLVVLTLLVGLVTLLVVASLSFFAVRRAFRPLTRIEDTAAAIAAGDLAQRIPPRGANDEVASLSDSLNAMLARIEHAFAVREGSERRMRQFVADASHELRTPLATVKGYAELYRVGGVTEPEDVAGAMRRIEGEATRMTLLVEDLLTLTRWDSEPRMEHQSVDLTVLASDVVQDARVRAPGRRVDLVPVDGADGTAEVLGDDGALRQVLTNLVANATSYTPAGSPVEVAVGRVQGHGVLEVRDHGSGIPTDAADRVFERFYREDKSRSRASGGTGLGLAIVAAIVAQHDGSVRHTPTPGGGATFRVELPATG